MVERLKVFGKTAGSSLLSGIAFGLGTLVVGEVAELIRAYQRPVQPPEVTAEHLR